MKLLRFFLYTFHITFAIQSIAQVPFVCDDRYFVTTENHLNELIIDWESDTFYIEPFLKELPHPIDAIGFNPVDNFIYGVARVGSENLFYKIDATGEAFFLDTLQIDYSQWNRAIKGGAFTRKGDFILSLISEESIDAPNGIVVIDPENPNDYSVTKASILGANPLVFIEDFSENPQTELLWAVQHYLEFVENPDSSFLQNFNFHNCFSTIDPIDFTVDNGSFPPLEKTAFSHGHISTMFHNSFLELFGQRLTEFYQFDIEKNKVKRIKIDRVEYTLDGCSCPYTLRMRQTVKPEITYPCTEVIYNFTIANFTQNTQKKVIFKDTFPAGFEVLEVVRNPFGGDIFGLNSNELTISNMEIPQGLDSIQVRVLLPEIVTGVFENQAYLKNVNLTGTNDLRTVIASDYPKSSKKDDPTPLKIIPFEVTVEGADFIICPDSSIAIQPLELLDNLSLNWSNGSTDSILVVKDAGIYGVTVSAGCNADSAVFEVIESPFSIGLEEVYEVFYGDSILIEPKVLSLNPIEKIEWNAIEENIISCPDCLTSFAHPKVDGWFWINATNSIGCVAFGKAYFRMKKEVYAANVFSPNSDGWNDIFYLQSKNDLPIQNFQIFDRWGNKVFERKTGLTNLISDGWDGQVNGKTAKSGVYLWKAEVIFAYGEKAELTGDILLIR
jgi:gliding motility-associated-like protein